MDPSVVVAAPPPKIPKLKLPRINSLYITGTLILAIAIAAAYFLPKLLNTAEKNLNSVKTVKSNPSLKINQSVNKTFSSSTKYQSIVFLSQAASSEKDFNKRYDLYKQLFAKISASYKQTKDPQMLLNLYQLRDYMLAAPNYKEGDFVIPK